MRFLIAVFLATFIFAADHNQLKIQAKVFEKILLLDTKIQDKLTQNPKIIILFSDKEELDAAFVQEEIIKNIKNNELLKTIKVEIKNYKEFKKENALAYFFLESSQTNLLKNIATHAIDLKIITFSYNPEYLEYGVMLSLKIEQTTYPLINPEAVLKGEIKFNPILIRISKRYKK